jgi:hypothetical protein
VSYRKDMSFADYCTATKVPSLAFDCLIRMLDKKIPMILDIAPERTPATKEITVTVANVQILQYFHSPIFVLEL